jgi:hypothetical protein
MDIRDELLTARSQSKKLANEIAQYACTSKTAFEEMMNCLFSQDYKLAQRAAYCVSKAAKLRRDLIQPYYETLVDLLKRTDIHVSVVRCCVSILQESDLPEPLHGEVMDTCFNFIQDRKAPIAVKAFSLTILHNLSKIYPEIKNELRMIIEESMEYETPAFKSRGMKIIRNM